MARCARKTKSGRCDKRFGRSTPNIPAGSAQRKAEFDRAWVPDGKGNLVPRGSIQDPNRKKTATKKKQADANKRTQQQASQPQQQSSASPQAPKPAPPRLQPRVPRMPETPAIPEATPTYNEPVDTQNMGVQSQELGEGYLYQLPLTTPQQQRFLGLAQNRLGTNENFQRQNPNYMSTFNQLRVPLPGEERQPGFINNLSSGLGEYVGGFRQREPGTDMSALQNSNQNFNRYDPRTQTHEPHNTAPQSRGLAQPRGRRFNITSPNITFQGQPPLNQRTGLPDPRATRIQTANPNNIAQYETPVDRRFAGQQQEQGLSPDMAQYETPVDRRQDMSAEVPDGLVQNENYREILQNRLNQDRIGQVQPGAQSANTSRGLGAIGQALGGSTLGRGVQSMASGLSQGIGRGVGMAQQGASAIGSGIQRGASAIGSGIQRGAELASQGAQRGLNAGVNLANQALPTAQNALSEGLRSQHPDSMGSQMSSMASSLAANRLARNTGQDEMRQVGLDPASLASHGSFEPIAREAMEDFQDVVVPSIKERYSQAGGLDSSGYRNELALAQNKFLRNLASQRTQYLANQRAQDVGLFNTIRGQAGKTQAENLQQQQFGRDLARQYADLEQRGGIANLQHGLQAHQLSNQAIRDMNQLGVQRSDVMGRLGTAPTRENIYAPKDNREGFFAGTGTSLGKLAGYVGSKFLGL